MTRPLVEVLPDCDLPVGVAAGLAGLAEGFGEGVLAFLLGVERADVRLAPVASRSARQSPRPASLRRRCSVPILRLRFFRLRGYGAGMSSMLRERTVLPPDDRSGLARLARGLAGSKAPSTARLVGPDGLQLEIPDELYGVLRDVVVALSQGLAISIAPHNTMLTTQEAADLLNISRPTLVRLLTDGEIAHTMRGRHRRVMLRDVLDYRERTRRERRKVLDQMAADAEDDGLYDVTAVPARTR